jgi:hypothetical protein
VKIDHGLKALLQLLLVAAASHSCQRVQQQPALLL